MSVAFCLGLCVHDVPVQPASVWNQHHSITLEKGIGLTAGCHVSIPGMAAGADEHLKQLQSFFLGMTFSTRTNVRWYWLLCVLSVLWPEHTSLKFTEATS